MELVSTCNVDCGCTTAGFEPICDNNYTVYFSPCHAGCTVSELSNGTKVKKKLQVSHAISKLSQHDHLELLPIKFSNIPIHSIQVNYNSFFLCNIYQLETLRQNESLRFKK